MTKEIADAFGLQPDSLERVVDDDLLDKQAPCQSCEGWAKKYAELEAVLSARNESNGQSSRAEFAQGEYRDFCV